MENIHQTHLAFEFENQFVFLPLYTITKKQLLENSECFNILLKGMQENTKEEIKEDEFNPFLFDMNGYLYAELEKRHYKTLDYVSIIYTRFENFLETLYLQSKIINPKNSIEVISLKEYENQNTNNDISILKMHLLFFFLTYLLFSKTQNLKIETKKTQTLSEGVFVTSLAPLEFISYIHSI